MIFLSTPYMGWQGIFETYKKHPYYEKKGTYNRRLNVFMPVKGRLYTPFELVRIAKCISNEYKKGDIKQLEGIGGLIEHLKELDKSDPVVQNLIRATVELANRSSLEN